MSGDTMRSGSIHNIENPNPEYVHIYNKIETEKYLKFNTYHYLDK